MTTAKVLEDIASQCEAGARIAAGGAGQTTIVASFQAIAKLIRAAAEAPAISDEELRWAICCGEVGHCNANCEAPAHEMSPQRFAERYGCESAEYDRQIASIKKLIASKAIAAPANPTPAPRPSYEQQGTGYDSGASGHELQGRASAPDDDHAAADFTQRRIDRLNGGAAE